MSLGSIFDIAGELVQDGLLVRQTQLDYQLLKGIIHGLKVKIALVVQPGPPRTE